MLACRTFLNPILTEINQKRTKTFEFAYKKPLNSFKFSHSHRYTKNKVLALMGLSLLTVSLDKNRDKNKIIVFYGKCNGTYAWDTAFLVFIFLEGKMDVYGECLCIILNKLQLQETILGAKTMYSINFINANKTF